MITKYDPLGKIKVVPVHVTKALKGIGVNVNLGPRCRLMVNFTPPRRMTPEETALSIHSVGDWAGPKPAFSVALVRERTIPTERPPPVGEVSANFCG